MSKSSSHRYLITGVGGFVAQHFIEYLERFEGGAVVLGVDIAEPKVRHGSHPFSFLKLNLSDREAVERCLLDFQPTRVLHLASVSSVGVSWKSPVESFTNNTNIFLNLLEGIRQNYIDARTLSVGSSEEYGQVTPEDLPLVETHPLSPSSPYGVARVAQEQLSRVYAQGFDVDIVMTRSFNHIGPGQRDLFVVPSLVKQAVRSKLSGEKRCTIRAGETRVIRDFLDVRDVVVAYSMLFEHGPRGEVFNICSGVGRSLDQILEILGNLLNLEIEVVRDPNLIRPNELMEVVGSPEKLQSLLGWKPRFDLRTSLGDLILEAQTQYYNAD